MAYVLNTTAYQSKACKLFARQTGAQQGTCMLSIGLVRTPLLLARLAFLGKRKLGRPLNERQYTIDCAIRAFTHFNPRHGFRAKSECLQCKCEIDDTSNISIVMLALPPWRRKTDTVKSAMMAGFFCAACDVRDDEAKTLWGAAIKEKGVEILSTNAGHA